MRENRKKANRKTGNRTRAGNRKRAQDREQATSGERAAGDMSAKPTARPESAASQSTARLRERIVAEGVVPIQSEWNIDAGETKMSEAILNLIEPMIEGEEDNPASVRMAVSFGVVAWNLAQCPKDAREKEIRRVVNERLLAGDELGAILFEETVRDLIENKRSLYPQDDRIIADFDLAQTPDGFHLNVAFSSPEILAQIVEAGYDRPENSTKASEASDSPPPTDKGR